MLAVRLRYRSFNPKEWCSNTDHVSMSCPHTGHLTRVCFINNLNTVECASRVDGWGLFNSLPVVHSPEKILTFGQFFIRLVLDRMDKIHQ